MSRVLLVTSEGAEAEAHAASLGERDREVVRAATAREAVERMAEAPAGVVVLAGEAAVPEVCRALRLEPRSAAVGVLVLVAPEDRSSIATLIEAGADDCLPLPVTPDELACRLEVVEARRRGGTGPHGRLPPSWGREESFRRLIESMNEGLGVRDAEGRVCYVNRRLAEMLGYRPEEMLGRPVVDFIHPKDRARFEAEVDRRRDGAAASYEVRMAAHDGSEVPTLQSGHPLFDSTGRAVGSFAVITDVTDWKRTERRLRLTQFTVDHAVDAVYWISPEGRFLYVNEAACSGLGYEREELLEMGVADIDIDLPLGGWAPVWRQLRERKTFLAEARHRRKDGSVFPVEISANLLSYGDREYSVAVARDITERKRVERELLHGALHDPLTGLPNRVLFMDRLGQCLRRVRRDGGRCAVLFLDLDRFKVVNDSLGHVVGDELLVEVANRLEKTLRAPDTIARIGGDEFLVLLEDVHGQESATVVAQRLHDTLGAPFEIGERELFVTASIGIALSPTESRGPRAQAKGEVERQRRGGDPAGEDAAGPGTPAPEMPESEDLLRDADIAMYRAKGRGGARSALFDEPMRGAAMSRLELETDLRRALDQGQLLLHYQPVLRVADAALAGFEALLRWKHPRRGLVSPDDFVHAAEEIGLGAPLAWWVLEEVGRQAALWREAGRPLDGRHLSLNLSASLVTHPELGRRLEAMVEASGIPASTFVVEITESVLLEDSRRALETLEAIRGLGLRLALDDFGAGYSALGHLARFPVDVVKIDRSFLAAHPERNRGWTIVRSVVELVHDLGHEVVAEGVQSEEQLEWLREVGCDLAQGFHFSPGMPPGEAGELLAEGAGAARPVAPDSPAAGETGASAAGSAGSAG